MPDVSVLTLTGARIEAAAAKVRLAACKLHLFKAGFNPVLTTTLAELLEQECDYAGYAEATIALWSDPVLAGAAYAIFAPTQTFRWVAEGDNIGNQCGGSFLVTATGDLVQFTAFGPTRPIQGVDQAIITTPTVVYAAG